MTGAPSDDLRDALDAGERIQWYGRSSGTTSRGTVLTLLVGAAIVAVVPFAWLGWSVAARPAVRVGLFAVPALALGACSALLYRLFVVRNGGREYAITDRRVLKTSGPLLRSFDARRWEAVASVEFDPKNHRVLRFPGTVGWGPRARLRRELGRVFAFRALPDGHEAYPTALAAHAEASGPPTASDAPSTPGRDAVAERVRAALQSDERLLARFEASHAARWDGYLAGGAVGLVGGPILAWLLVGLVGVVTPLAVTLPVAATTAGLAGPLCALGSVAWVYRDTERRAYVATDRRVLAFDGRSADPSALAWTETATLQRRGRHVVAYDRDPRDLPSFSQGPAGPAIKPRSLELRYLARPRATFWRLRAVADERG